VITDVGQKNIMIISGAKIRKEENIKIEFAIIQNGNDVGVIIECIGDYGLGSLGNDNGNFIGAMTVAALHRWRCRFIVFDFSKMKYDMSDSLAGIAHAIKKMRSPNYEVYIITSPLSDKGIRSLVNFAQGIFNPTIISNLSEIWPAQQNDAPERFAPGDL
jgi:hypothetical protein